MSNAILTKVLNNQKFLSSSIKLNNLSIDQMNEMQLRKFIEIECSKLLVDITQMTRKMLMKI